MIKIPINRRGINSAADLKLFLSYKKIIKKINSNMVIAYTIKLNVYGSIACCLLKMPYAINSTG